MKKLILLVCLLGLVATVTAQEEVIAFDLKLKMNYLGGNGAVRSEKLNAILVLGDFGEDPESLIVFYEKGDVLVGWDMVEYFEMDGQEAAKGTMGQFMVAEFPDGLVYLTSFGKFKEGVDIFLGSMQTKGVGVMVEGDFDDIPPGYTYSLRYNSKLTASIENYGLENAVAAYLAKKAKVPEGYVLDELGDNDA